LARSARQEEFLREFREEVLPLIQRLENSIAKHLALLSYLNTWLERSGVGRLVIVGGFAVELYSGGSYRTIDIDLVVEGVNAVSVLQDLLEVVGFELRSRHRIPVELRVVDKAIEVVSTIYDKPKNPVRVEVGRYWCYVESPEESVISCLSAYVYWESDVDFEKAVAVLRAQRDRIDRDYLVKRAREASVHDSLEKAMELALAS